MGHVTNREREREATKHDQPLILPTNSLFNLSDPPLADVMNTTPNQITVCDVIVLAANRTSRTVRDIDTWV